MDAHEQLDILLVEDDDIDQMAFDRFVKQHSLPYTVTTATTVAEAEQALATHHFDAILSDFQLPDGNALEVLRLSGKTPTIVVTGAGNEKIAVDAMKAGARDYLIKDHERNYLHVMPITVQNAIQRYRMEMERERLLIELQQALSDIKTLHGLLPICAMCKKIRDDKGYWNHLEKYIQEHTEAQFTHGYCPDCARKLFQSMAVDE